MAGETSGYGYGKRPMWQWVLLYVIIGGILYGFVYYFVFAGHSYSYTAPMMQGSNSVSQQPFAY